MGTDTDRLGADTARRRRGRADRPARRTGQAPPLTARRTRGQPAVGHTGTPLQDRIRQRHTEVNELAATGMSLAAIGRRLQLDRKTVRRYRDKDLAGLLASAQDRGHGVLEPFMK